MTAKKTEKPASRSGQPWRGSFNRPMKVDPESYDPLTAARMTDHNVKGVDPEEEEPSSPKPLLPPENKE